MKGVIPQIILIILFCVPAFPQSRINKTILSSASGQESNILLSGGVIIKVSIIKPLSIGNYKNSKINFGEIVMDGENKYGKVTNENGAHFLITGQPNRNVTIDYPQNIILNNTSWTNINSGTSGTLLFSAYIAEQTGSYTSYKNASTLPSGTTTPLVPLSENDGTGYLNIWVGGSIYIPASTPNGDYLGSYYVSVHY